MPTTGGTKSAASPYQLQLFSNLPLYTTQLVCETKFPFCERIQVSAPADVVPILQEYFRLKDREEMIVVLLDTANTILGLSLVSVGGLAASIVGFLAQRPQSVHSTGKNPQTDNLKRFSSLAAEHMSTVFAFNAFQAPWPSSRSNHSRSQRTDSSARSVSW